MALERLPVAQLLRRAERAASHERLGDERRRLIHERKMVEPHAVPLEHGELRIVQPSRLAVAEYLADLVNRAGACGQQPLHREFRRGMRIKHLPPREQGPGVARGEALQVGIGGGGAGQNRRFNLEHAACGEKRPDALEHPGAELQDFEGGRGAPVRFSFKYQVSSSKK